MALKPLGNRILVKPDEQPEQTDSGLVLPGDRDHVPVSGTVVAVGDGPARDAQIRSAVILRCIGIVEELAEQYAAKPFDSRDWCVHEREAVQNTIDELRRYRNQMEQFDGLKAGERVVYPADVGLKITEDGIDYIILNEDDAVVIATEEESAA